MPTSSWIIALPVCLGLIACGDNSGAAANGAAAGSILITLSGETVGRDAAGHADSAQCQLQPKVSNLSALDLKSLIAEFEISRASDGGVIEATATLTMPMAIAAGQRQDAWGPLLVDGYRCEDLSVTLLPAAGYQCRTASKAPCPAYRLETSGLAGAK